MNKTNSRKILQIICIAICAAALICFMSACGPAENETMTYTGGTLAAGTVGTAYEGSVATADAGDAEVTYALASGSTLPAGLTLSGAGVISGTPTAAATSHTFTVTASAEGYDSANAQFTITIAEQASITYTAAELNDARVGTEYSESVARATGATGITYALKAGSELPAGLELGDDGAITGTPTEAVSGHTFTVVATSGTLSAEATFTINVVAAGEPTTFVMESEYVDFMGKSGPGMSTSATELEMIMTDLTGSKQASNGHYVGYCHGVGIYFEYYFESDIDTTATLILRLGSDQGDVSDYGNQALGITLNDENVAFSERFTLSGKEFQDYTITTELPIQAGENKLVLTVLESDVFQASFGSFETFGPLYDCVKIVSYANLTWDPILTNC